MLTLHSADLAGITRALQLLASPLDHLTVDEWRSAVNSQFKMLFKADSAGFLLPGVGGPLFFSEEHDPAEIARYPDLTPPARRDGRAIWDLMIQACVVTMPSVYGPDIDEYLNSAYYNEYAAPNGACDTLAAMLPLGGPDPRNFASVQLWRNGANPRAFGDRERAMLGLLLPSLEAGIHAHVRWGNQRGELLRTLDSLGHAVAVYDATRGVVHHTPSLERLLKEDPDADALRSALHQVSASVRSLVVVPAKEAADVATPITREMRTRTARYMLRGSTYRGWNGGVPMFLVSVDRLTRLPRLAGELRAYFGLTESETRVAILLAEGQSSAQIASALSVSVHTVRRHTERVFMRLCVHSRAEVGAKLAY